jgi:hypothetical protein
MRFSSQNLNDKVGGEKGSMWREGRCWWYLDGNANKSAEKVVRFSWAMWSNLNTIGIKLDLATWDDVFSIGFHFWKVHFWFGFEYWKLQQWLSKKIKRSNQAYGNGRVIGLECYSGHIWINLWQDPMESRSVDPWWWHFSFDVMKVFGKVNYSEQTIEERQITIPMPEKAYNATARLFVSVWKRPLGFERRLKRIEIKIPDGIPFEGKGENSWDLGQDATFGITCPANSIPEGVGHLVGSVLKDRVKNGGWNDWVWTKEVA